MVRHDGTRRRCRRTRRAEGAASGAHPILHGSSSRETPTDGFNKHPPLGVNATRRGRVPCNSLSAPTFQWAPTLGGECYEDYHHDAQGASTAPVSMGTHPWG